MDSVLGEIISSDSSNMSNFGSNDVFDSSSFMALSGVLIFYYVIMLAFAIVCAVLQAVAIYTIAKRRGHERPWLAWIPVAGTWLFGRLSDQYKEVAQGKKQNRAKLLLGLDIAILASFLLYFILIFALAASVVSGSSDAASAGILAMFMVLIAMAMLVLAIIYSVFTYMTWYDLFASCDPSKKVVFIILTIIFGIQAFFIFAVRNKDLGMYPQYSSYNQYPPYNTPNSNMYNQSGYNNGNTYNQNGYNGYNQNTYNGYNQTNYNNGSYGYNPNNFNQDNNNQQ